MWLAYNCLYLALLITGALPQPVDSPTGRRSSRSGLPGIARPSQKVLSKNAPFYLQRLVSIDKITTWKDMTELKYEYSWNPSASGNNVVVYVIDTGTSH
ncbi:hypothetical protein H0H93_002119 [Arthromyces matolae]|nr:hypothetical protein H0H93_002119 [Arthromyces matolae]